MNDFTSQFWSLYIAVLTVVSIVGCAILLWMQTTKRVPGAKIGTTGHVWDEDLQEWNNPLPNWWRWLFYITVVFSLVYLAFYPGLGNFRGTLGWSQTTQYDDEMEKADATYGPIYAKYQGMDIEKLAADTEAMAIGQNLYLNYCAQCHASDARGTKGFPNLADGDWLWGGDPKTIEEDDPERPYRGHAAAGRRARSRGGEGRRALRAVALGHDERLDPGRARARRNLRRPVPRATAPTARAIRRSARRISPTRFGCTAVRRRMSWRRFRTGRTGQMPAWKEFLGEPRAHVLAAYVWGLSHSRGSKRVSGSA